jgi:peptidoglycan/xylan/chitin deacetylase (PgdA/CDA1 family)
MADIARKVRLGFRALALWAGVAATRSSEPPPDRILLLHGSPSCDAAMLERQLRYLKRRFQVVPLAEILDRRAAAPRCLAPRVALTFDDGLRNNLSVAYPILQRLGLPATFFVCPGLIDEGRWLWTHEARQRLRYAGPERVASLARHLGAGGSVAAIIQHMKELSLGERVEAEEVLQDATPAWLPSAEERHAFDLATWDELRTLDPSLISIGSHTLTHPTLASLSTSRCEREICESAARIERALGRAADFLAYPDGGHTPLARQLAARPYRAAVTRGGGPVSSASDPFALPRIGVPRGLLRLASAMDGHDFAPGSGVKSTRPAFAAGA